MRTTRSSTLQTDTPQIETSPGQRHPWKETHPRTVTPPRVQTDTCENIILPQTSFACGNKCNFTFTARIFFTPI